MRPRSVPAPDFAVGTIPPPIRTRPRLLAFLRSWSPAPEIVSGLRDRLRDAELVVLTDAGVWQLSGDDMTYCDRLPGDVATAVSVTRLRDGNVVMFDASGTIHRAPSATTLDGAIESLLASLLTAESFAS